MLNQFSNSELAAYLEEDLDADRASNLEEMLVQNTELQERLRQIRQQIAAGEHSLGSIWRQHNLSCPNREVLGGYLLGILPAEHNLFIQTHIETRGCLTCQANLADLEEQQTLNQKEMTARTTRYYKSSVGHFSQHRNND